MFPQQTDKRHVFSTNDPTSKAAHICRRKRLSIIPTAYDVSHITTIGGPATFSFANALNAACASHFSS